MPAIKKFNPRSRNRFREAELARAVRAAIRAGAKRVKVDPETGTITVLIDKADESENPDTPERIISKL